MPKIHIMDAPNPDNPTVYRAVADFATPTGTNDVGTTWKVCYLASLAPAAPSTILQVGNTAGNISQQESQTRLRPAI